MIVRLIIGGTDSNINGISLVNGKEEDQVPDAPKGNGDDGKENSREHGSSGRSGVLSEEVYHHASSNGGWDQKEEHNENVPPWEILVQ